MGGHRASKRATQLPTERRPETRTQCIRVEPLHLVWPLLFQIVRHLWCLATYSLSLHVRVCVINRRVCTQRFWLRTRAIIPSLPTDYPFESAADWSRIRTGERHTQPAAAPRLISGQRGSINFSPISGLTHGFAGGFLDRRWFARADALSFLGEALRRFIGIGVNQFFIW